MNVFSPPSKALLYRNLQSDWISSGKNKKGIFEEIRREMKRKMGDSHLQTIAVPNPSDKCLNIIPAMNFTLSSLRKKKECT